MKQSPIAPGRRRQYADEALDDYLNWREACAAVALSYESWRRAESDAENLAFSAYLAALDREEGAATAYQRSVAQLAAA
jgi:hypothetical protein